MPSRHRIRVTRLAESHIREAARWWQANRPAAPNAIREELEQAFELLSLQPRLGAIARNPRLSGVRRVHLGRTGYYLYYRIREVEQTIEVLAFWHSSRGSEPNP